MPCNPNPAGRLPEKTGRGERIRTSGLYVPNVALYQTKLHPENCLSKLDPKIPRPSEGPVNCLNT